MTGKEAADPKKRTSWIVIAIPFAVALFWLSITHAIEFSTFAATILLASIGLGAAAFGDKVLLPNVNTITELKRGNTAWGLAFLGVCVIIGAAIIAV